MFRAHISLMRGYFGLERSDQRSLPDDTSTWVGTKEEAIVERIQCELNRVCMLKDFCFNVLTLFARFGAVPLNALSLIFSVIVFAFLV